MITFETQGEFEDAVMKVLKDRLSIDISGSANSEIAITLSDMAGGVIDSDSVHIS